MKSIILSIIVIIFLLGGCANKNNEPQINITPESEEINFSA